jgi:glycosyltransferase involved in cell wall biosynthesis
MNNQKKTVLMLCDHPLASSGVATQSRWLINGLVETGKWKFKVFGGALKHDSYNQVTVNQDFMIKPVDGFGTKELLRTALYQIKPDVLLLFTDPRFFTWVWEMEDEIHQICPIAYNHLWDNGPYPDCNDNYYESTDLINCINWPTYEMLSKKYPHKTNFIPHGVPSEIYSPINEDEIKKYKKSLLGNRSEHFTALFVSRNARRKMANSIIESWSLFINELDKKYGHKNATLIMHCDPNDKEGPDLFRTVKLFNLENNVVFSKNTVDFKELSLLYNITDVMLSMSSAEGFGLSTLEGLMCGKPMIAIKTGGLTRQVENFETGEQYGIGLDPEVSVLAGNQLVPYIYEDYVSCKTYSTSIMKMFEMNPLERKELGLKGMEYARKNFNIDDTINSWDRTLSSLVEEWPKTYKRWEKVVI